GGLIGRRGGLALHGGLGLDDFQNDLFRQFQTDRTLFVRLDDDLHAFLQIGDAVFADPALLQFDLLVGFVVHEDERFAVVEQVGVVALFQRDALDLVFRAEAFVQLVAGLEVFGLDVGEGAALAGLDVAGLGDDPQAAVVLQDHAGLDGVGVDFHGNRRARCWGAAGADRQSVARQIAASPRG